MKSMPFAFGDVQKDFSRKHLFYHSTRLFWSLLNLITCFVYAKHLLISLDIPN